MTKNHRPIRDFLPVASLVLAALVLVPWSEVARAASTVVKFSIDDDFPANVAAGAQGQGVFSDGAAGGAYADYRVDPSPRLNWCVDAEPISPGNLFVRFNRKLDGESGVLRCSDNQDPEGPLGVPRQFVLRIANRDACNRLADSNTLLQLTDAAEPPAPWTGTSELPCLLPSNDNPRIRLGSLYKARARTTAVDFLTFMFGSTRSFEIRSDTEAAITPDKLDPTRKAVQYTGTFHLVQFDPGVKAKTVGQAFTMPVHMEFKTEVVP